MTWRNVRNLYKNICKAKNHNENVISIFSEDNPYVIYDQKHWWSDKWDPLDYGQDYDFSKTFFVQLSSLIRNVPLPNLSNVNPIDTEYTNQTIDSKNCYLVFGGFKNENCLYSDGINECHSSLDLLASQNNENVYDSTECRNCFNVSFGFKSSECIESKFIFNCKNCSNCFGCWNLRNKSYCIWNKQYTKEEYNIKIKEFNLCSYANFLKLKDFYQEKLIIVKRRYADIVNSNNVSGSNIEFSKNCRNSFDINGVSESKYVWRLLTKGGSNNYDITVATKPELCYEGQGVGAGYNSKFCIGSGNISNSHYCFSCISGGSNCFGCVSLNNKSYCILNRQYTREEYEELVPKIIKHMNDMPYIDKKGRVYKYGEFFPSELSPFAYNETMAQEYYPLTKEQAIEQGYKWKDKEERNYSIDIHNTDIPDNINDTDESIIGKVIECAHKGTCNQQCTEAFKLIPEEYQFYKRMNLPIPRLCPNCRHYERLAQRNPMKLWHRQCMKEGCTNEFETSYAPDRPEIVYCDGCYKREVY
jgi:hypothetical protein